MLRGINAPTDLASMDKDPHVPPEAKLGIIRDSPVYVHRSLNSHKLTLPFVEGLAYTPVLTGKGHTMHIERMNVGDKALYRQGIGTRLLQAAIRYGLEQESRTLELSATGARLGLLNTVIGVLGAENVTTELRGNRYGAGTDQSLETMLTDFPFVEGEPYKIQGVWAQIDPTLAEDWVVPQEIGKPDPAR
jgi:hypothetical protein